MGFMNVQFTPDQKEGIGNGVRLVGAWGSASMTKMAELTAWAQTIAEIGAAVLTVLLVLEFLIKKVILPFCRWRGWIKDKKGKKHDSCE